MKYLFAFLASSLLVTNTVCSQTPEDSIKMTINNLFAAMKQADPLAIKATFADSAILQTILRNKEGGLSIRTGDLNSFAEQIRTLKQGDADERIRFETIKIDGPLAIVWTPYSFYYKAQFSHCGVNSFQLVRMQGGWKIQYLIDTRRNQDCL
ncbi:MAG: nuclear transport factor 2 family protein [Chitinophagaceae bacterium]|nr:nuclear transport factor 2 family protein [Chitinophagaceae bacterium]